MKKIKITQVKSSIGYRRRAKATLAALGLKKIIQLHFKKKFEIKIKTQINTKIKKC